MHILNTVAPLKLQFSRTPCPHPPWLLGHQWLKAIHVQTPQQ